MPGSVFVIAHRGACGYRPEHSRSAYELACTLGAHAVEPDVVMSRDGVLVVRHENELSGTTDIASRAEFASRRRRAVVDGVPLTGWFTEDFTWDELSTLHCAEPMPTIRPENTRVEPEKLLRLADVLEIVDAGANSVHAVVELKHGTYFDELGLPLDDALTRELELAGWARDDERLILESFELDVLQRCRSAGVGASHVYLMDTDGIAPDQLARLGKGAPGYAAQREPAQLAALALAVDGISIPVDLLMSEEGRDTLDRAHALGMTVYTFTLRPENRFLPEECRVGSNPGAWGNWQEYFDAVVATGVDGVFADHPDLVLARQ